MRLSTFMKYPLRAQYWEGVEGVDNLGEPVVRWFYRRQISLSLGSFGTSRVAINTTEPIRANDQLRLILDKKGQLVFPSGQRESGAVILIGNSTPRFDPFGNVIDYYANGELG